MAVVRRPDPDDQAGRRGNPRPQRPNDDPGLHENRAPGRSLVEDLGGEVDDIRQLYTDFGLRPYRVFSIVVRWSGGERGRGEPQLVSEQELLPTPRVRLEQLRTTLRSAGLVDDGTVPLDQISPRYTEDDVKQLFHQQPLPQGHEGFIEVVHDARDGQAMRRRFVVSGTPERQADKFQWRCKLRDQDPARRRSGQLRNVRGLGVG